MSKPTKKEVLDVILREARIKQGTEAQACVELAASTEIEPLIVVKGSLVNDVAKTLAAKYAVTFPKDLGTLGTFDGAAAYIVDNADA